MLINCSGISHCKKNNNNKLHIHQREGKKWENGGFGCVCLCVGGEAPMKMHFMHYFSISDISCFMDLFKSSQVDRKGEEGEAEVRDMQNKKHPPLANVLPLSSFCLFFYSFHRFFKKKIKKIPLEGIFFFFGKVIYRH